MTNMQKGTWQNIIKTFLLSLILFLNVGETPGKLLKFDHVLDLGVETTQAFLQDRDGFLWFGSAGGGLFRYDGYDLKNYGIGPNALRTGTVLTLLEDRANPDIIWLAAGKGGFARFDTTTEAFIHYSYDPAKPDALAAPSVEDIVQDSVDPNSLWILGGGLLQRFDTTTKTFSPNYLAPNAPGAPENRDFYSLLEDPEHPNSLWLAGFGLAKFDKTTAQFTVYRNEPGNPQSLGFESNYIAALAQDKEQPDVLWLGYWDDAGLDKFEKSRGTFTHYTHNPAHPQSLRDGAVQLLHDDGQGVLWLGGWAASNGLTAFDKRAETFTTFTHIPDDPDSVSTDTIVNVTRDQSGILWIVNLSGKIDKYDPYTQNFRLYQHHLHTANTLVNNAVYAMFEDRDGLLWFGTIGGLSRFDRVAETFTHYTHDPQRPDSLDADYILCMYEDSAGDFWIGAYSGPLMRFDQQTGQVRERIALRDGGSVAEILEDPEHPDILWIGGVYSGFAKFTKTDRALQYYPYDPEHPEKGLSASDITEMLHDNRDPLIWLSSWSGDGLYKFDKTTETFTQYRANPSDPQGLSYGEIGGLYQDAAGILWIGTRGGGLNSFDKTTGQFTRYGKEEGVPSTINAILPDDHGNLWLSSNNGIVRFNGKAKRVNRNYTVSDGLQGNAFLYESGLRTADGTLWFGGTNGVNSFHPDALVTNPHVPPVMLTALTQGGEIIANVAPHRLTEMTLSWRNNFFEFQYAALNYSIPGKNQYSYQLEGLDQDWYTAGTKRTGRYAGLPHGTYTLRIRGSNNDGVWNEQGVSLRVTVIPPFWRRWWFRVAGMLLLIGSGITGHYVRLRSLKKQKETLERLVQERTEQLYQAKKRAEEAMYETERRFRVIFNQTFQFIGLARPDGSIRELNQTTLTFFNVAEAEIVGKYLWEVPWFDRPEERAKIQEAVAKAAQGDFVRFETSALAPDGQRVILDFSMKPMWGEFDNIYLLILEGRDLTDYRRTEEALRETIKVKERMESELRIAHEIQMEIIPRTFPPFPDRKEIDIYAMLEPAKEVGGDLYDFFFIDEAHLCFVIGDVSDKGVPAALFMSAAKTLIKAIATRTFPGPNEQGELVPRIDAVLTAVNYELAVENDACMFVTVFCGILDTRTGAVCYTNAGHNPPLLLRHTGDVQFVDEHRCTVIGADEDAVFTQAEFTIQPGDRLLLYTDGITEAMNNARELFTEERLQQAVRSEQSASVRELVDGILEVVRTFVADAPQADDMTILALAYLQKSEGETP